MLDFHICLKGNLEMIVALKAIQFEYLQYYLKVKLTNLRFHHHILEITNIMVVIKLVVDRELLCSLGMINANIESIIHCFPPGRESLQ